MATNYIVSFARIIALVLPSCLQLPTIMSLAKSAFIALPQQAFEQFRRACLFRLNHNGQICFLRSALNSEFISSLTNVHFDIAEAYGEIKWLYAADEKQGVHIMAQNEVADASGVSGTHIYAPNEDLLNGAHKFVIYVPSDLFSEPKLSKIKQFVNQYRLPSSIPIYKPTNS